MVATSVGVNMPSLRGAILFLEFHRAGLGTVDRYLTQLLESGALEGVVGVVLGSFERARGTVDRGWSMIDVLHDRLGRLNVPILGGIPAGHNVLTSSLSDAPDGFDQVCLPLGSMATIDADEGTLWAEAIVE